MNASKVANAGIYWVTVAVKLENYTEVAVAYSTPLKVIVNPAIPRFIPEFLDEE